jgi:hypothetical protein
MNIPVIINNRNLYTWVVEMVDKIKTYENVGDIIIIDNDSDYPPLLEWYETNPCTIYKTQNFGHTAPWHVLSDLLKNSEYYVITDADMGLLETPSNTLLYLKENLDLFGLNKIGLGLNWEIVKEDSLYYNHLQSYEKNRWLNSNNINNIYIDIPIDTTFAMHKKGTGYFIGGASTTYPYVARHYPWEFTKETYENNEEFKYYIKNANGSSSYKTYLNL